MQYIPVNINMSGGITDSRVGEGVRSYKKLSRFLPGLDIY